MLAFEIEIDGERAFVAGVEDWSLLSFHLTARRDEDVTDGNEAEIDTHMGGMTIGDENKIRHHFRWSERKLRVGSAVTVRVVDIDLPDPPVKRFRSDAEIQECPFTEEEMRQMRYDDYLA